MHACLVAGRVGDAAEVAGGGSLPIVIIARRPAPTRPRTQEVPPPVITAVLVTMTAAPEPAPASIMPWTVWAE
ncbi:hypothetical protein AB0L65_17760 [Nonomuraea sp. NPDC052116]|uniref:hypothetical protein n=1 Tax=Nonomuraea sp. NPDC052116 TaxID=3155665 RepID=UPI003444A645